jgi:hypothetical protein
MSEHTPGQLIRVGYRIASGSRFVAECFPDAGYSVLRIESKDECVANAKHLVACWNNCEGLNPERVPELLKALKSAAIELDLYDDRAAADCRAAIAKVERP